MATKYKLTYFDFKARGELTRLMFALGGQKFEDYRFPREDWPKEKSKTPFGWIPVLTFNGKSYCDSMGIAKFVAREFGNGGETSLQMLEIDQVTGIVVDTLAALSKLLFAEESKKAEVHKQSYEETFPKYLQALEKILTENGTGFFVGKKITVADVAVFDSISERIEDSLLSKYPKIKANLKTVAANDRIKAYIATRKQTQNMPTYRYRYFNARGLGEVSRLLFAIAGKDYEDVRFTSETWPAEKPNTPLGQVPVLEIDGKPFSQSSAISRYLARTFGYYGKDDMQALEVDQVLGIGQDVMTDLIKSVYEKDESRKAECAKANKEVKFPVYMGMFEKLLKNNKETGFFVGESITLADLYVFDLYEKIKSMVTLDDYPLFKKCIDHVGSNEKIKAWVEKRPVTEN
ncbi:glutathione S-transferase 1-like [Haliotis rufescens]|uniref:glutathione S-transferase 1-like n=1 Tax=Haliotis rufescens TaxID=6454 RepID=UPI00201E9F0B|nr:glutathione S-transferase 1-like [Haliotis rufescens]